MLAKRDRVWQIAFMRRNSLGALVLLALAPFSAAAVQGPPTPDILVEQLVATLPDIGGIGTPPDPPSAAREENRLEGLNPGREAEVSAVMLDWLNCVRPQITAATQRAVREVIRALGARKTILLLQFYRGPDFQRFLAFRSRLGTGALSPAEGADLQRIMAAYPLEEFTSQVEASNQIAARDQQFLAGIRQCSIDKQAALDRLGLRYR